MEGLSESGSSIPSAATISNGRAHIQPTVHSSGAIAGSFLEAPPQFRRFEAGTSSPNFQTSREDLLLQPRHEDLRVSELRLLLLASVIYFRIEHGEMISLSLCESREVMLTLLPNLRS